MPTDKKQSKDKKGDNKKTAAPSQGSKSASPAGSGSTGAKSGGKDGKRG